MNPLAQTILDQKYAHTLRSGRKETWKEVAHRTAKYVLQSVDAGNLIPDTTKAIEQRKVMPGGRYLAATGRPYHQTQNCLLLRADDSREGWSELLYRAAMALMSGAGIGVNYSALRPEGSHIRRSGGTSTGPLALVQMVNEVGRGIVQGGNRRAAIWAGLNWTHADVLQFASIKNWSEDVQALKAKDFSFPAPLDMTNISVGLDDDFFKAYHDPKSPQHGHAHTVYWLVVEQMMRTGEPGFFVNHKGEDLRNACGEVTSSEDSDVCNLGSINMSRVHSLDEMEQLVRLATRFLVAGTVYSDVPYAKVDQIRTKNRRLGLGLMGIHEWLLTHGKRYGPDDDLAKYLEIYAEVSGEEAKKAAKEWDLSTPIKTRAIAPNGTVGIVAETTTGLEPVFCVAYKRRYLKHKSWAHQYVVDPTAKRLIENGIPSEQIEDAYTLAVDVERRVAFQAWVQQYVDHAISSTINLPAWGSEFNNASLVKSFGNMLLKYLPNLRGITAYPDGARSGQPLTPVSYQTAMKHVGEVFEESANVCSIKGGSCGE